MKSMTDEKLEEMIEKHNSKVDELNQKKDELSAEDKIWYMNSLLNIGHERRNMGADDSAENSPM